MTPKQIYCSKFKKTLKVTDSLGMRIDKGIRRLTALMWCMGIPTLQSCEGHLDHGSPYPWVDVCALNEIGYNDINVIELKLQKMILHATQIYPKIQIKILEFHETTALLWNYSAKNAFRVEFKNTESKKLFEKYLLAEFLKNAQEDILY